MSESEKAFALLVKQQTALTEKIIKNARRIATEMVIGQTTLVDGVYIPAAHLILKELEEEVKKEVTR